MPRPLSLLSIRAAFGLAAFLLCACGGSQQSPPVPGPQQPGNAPAKGAAFARVTVVIKLPPRHTTAGAARTSVVRAAARRASPLFISPAIASVTVSVSAPRLATTSVTSNVVCSGSPLASCSVTATILAPVQADDTFTVVAYDGPSGTGNVLSSNAVTYPVDAGAVEQLRIVLQGTPAAIVAVNVGNPNPVTGGSATSTLSVTAADADGYVIAGTYSAPLNLQLYEYDSEGLFSFVPGGFVKTTATVASSTSTVNVYLKAKLDVTTPDDATIVASLPGAPYVPVAGGPLPPRATLGEITTVCPAASPVCVYYPNAYQTAAVAASSDNESLNTWYQAYVVPGTAADPGGGSFFWNVVMGFGSPTNINSLNTATGTFAAVSGAAPPVTTVEDIQGSFWGLVQDANTANTDVVNFSASGTSLATYPTALPGPGGIEQTASAFDAYGKLWSITGDEPSGGLFALNPANGASYACSFEITDNNFAGASATALAVAGTTVWVGVSGSSDGYTYVFKVPAQVPGSGCNLTALEHPATEFQLNELIGDLDVTSIAVDAAGDAFALQLTAVTKITPGGVEQKLVDTGLSAAQAFTGIAVSGSALYLVDFQPGSGAPYAGTGTLDKASALSPAANPLPSFELPPVLDLPNCSNCGLANPAFFQPYVLSNGSLWIVSAPFSNPALPFNLIGTGPTYIGGLVRIDVGSVAFTASKVHAGALDPMRIRQLLRAQRARRARRAFLRRPRGSA